MSTEENKAAIRAWFATIDREHNMSSLDKLAAPGYKAVFPGMPDVDIEGMKGFGDAFFAAFPDISHSVDEVIGEGDSVALRMMISGTQTQPLQLPTGTIPPTGRRIDMPVMNMFRMANGKVVEQRGIFDILGMLQQESWASSSASETSQLVPAG